MVYSVGTAILQVVPSFTGLQTKTKEAAREIQKQLADAVRQGLSDGLGAGPALAPAKRTGTQVGATLGQSIRAQLQAALRSLPEPKIGAATTEAEQKVRDLREQIATLSGRIGIDVSSADAGREIADIQAKLEALSSTSTDLDIRADTERAAAALARITAEIDRLEGRTPTVVVDIQANEGRFAARLQAAVEAAQAALPEILIDISSTPAEAAIATLRARLDTLRGREIDVDISAADALAELAAIRGELDVLAASGADIRVDVDAAAASAELASFEALVAAVDANDVDVDVKLGPDAASAPGRIIAIAVALASLLPALAPIAAVSAGAFGGIGAAAVAALPGLATLGFALYGVFEAVRQLAKADADAAKASATIDAARAASASAARGVQQAEAGLANTRASAAAQAVAGARTVEQAKQREATAEDAAARAAADAADRVTTAQDAVAHARRDAGEAAEASGRRVADAERAVAAAAEDAARRVQTAVDRQADAERSLAQAQRDAKDAQDAITEARKTADEQLQDLTLSVEQGAIRQKQAVFDAQDAQAELLKVMADPAATQREKEQAQLRVDAALASVKDIQLRNARLQAEQTQRTAAGVEGQDVYTEAVERAKNAVIAQNQAEKDAADAAAATAKARADGQQAVTDAQQAATNARTAQDRQQRDSAEAIAAAEKTLTGARADAVQSEVDGQQRIADARDAVTQAVVAQAEQQRQAAFAISSAENGVVSARDAAAQAAIAEGKAVAAAGADARAALASLSPAGAAFAAFLYSLRGPLGDLRAAAQESFLPGLQAGLEALLPVMPTFLHLTEVFGTALGDLAKRFGESLGGPVFTRFFDFLDRQAGPTLDKLGTIFGNVFGGLLDLFVGFEPYLQPFLDGILGVTGAFATFAANLSSNPAFQDFLAYVQAQAPLVSQFFGQLLEFIVRLGIAFAPMGEAILLIATNIFEFLNELGPDNLLKVLILVGGALAVLAGAFEAPILAVVGVVLAITALIGYFVRLYQENETLRTIVDETWAGIQAAISFAWEKIIQPALAALRDFVVNTLAPALVNLWHGVVEPAFAGIGAVVKFIWENVISPALGALVFYWQNILAPALNFLWHNIFEPAFSAIGTIISVWWAAVRIIFDALVFVFQKTIGPALEFLWKNVFEPAFSGIGSVVKTVWETVISPALESLRKFFVETLGPAISTGVSAFTAAFDLIREAARTPINFIIDTVYTGGIKKLFDKVAETVGSDTRMPVIDSIPAVAGKARGGFILPGDSSFRDGDDQLVPMRRGEGVAVSEAMRDPYERARLLELNRRAMRGESLRPLQVAGFAAGGLIPFGKHLQSIGYTVSEHPAFGGVTAGAHAVGSQHYNRSGPGGGGAIDVNSRPGTSTLEQTELDRILPSLANQYGLRSIWRYPNHFNHGHADILDSANLGAGAGATRAVGNVLANLGDLAKSGFDGALNIGQKIGDKAVGAFDSVKGALGSAWDSATSILSPFTDAVAGMRAGIGDSPFAQLAGDTFGKAVDDVKSWVTGAIAGTFGAGDSQDVNRAPVSAAPGVEKWRATALQALQLTGSPESWITSLLRRMNQESGGDPNAVNRWDSNAAKGTPSKGLLQTIDSTFKAYALPGYSSNVFDPLSNIIASIRYAEHFDGDATHRWDRKGGYATGGILDRLPVQPKPLLFDSGGYLPPGQNLVVNNLGRPEPLGNLEDLMTPAARNGGDGTLMQSLFRDVYPSEKADWELAFREAGFALHSSGLGG